MRKDKTGSVKAVSVSVRRVRLPSLSVGVVEIILEPGAPRAFLQ